MGQPSTREKETESYKRSLINGNKEQAYLGSLENKEQVMLKWGRKTAPDEVIKYRNPKKETEMIIIQLKEQILP